MKERADWVEVREEPNHFHRYENAYVRVYDVRFEPGQRSLYHRHDEDTLYIAVHATRVREQRWGESRYNEIDLPAGLAACRNHRSEPLIHVVENRGEGPMRMIGAEVKASPPVVADAPLDAPGHAPHPQQPTTARLRLYQLQLDPGQSTGNIRYGFSGLTIFITEANLEIVERGDVRRVLAGAPGDNIWHDGPRELQITNVGPDPYRAVLGEWC